MKAMSLDPDAKRVVEIINASGRPRLETLRPHEAREIYRSSRRVFSPDPPEVAEVRALSTGEIGMRFYRGLETFRDVPILVFIHGGGFCIGDLDTHDYVCRKLANEARCAVVSVDYRLAPEHKFPASVEDCSAAIHWIVDHAQALGIDSSRVAVGGDSAGGNLSAVMSHMARDGDLPPICFQVLLYPSVDMDMRHPSYQLDFSGLPLSLDTVSYFHRHYLNDDSDRADWRASPIQASNFRALAPAFILTVGCDPLRDEGAEYAKILEENDVPVTFVHMSDQLHGFLTMGRFIRAADTALELVSTSLRHAFQR